MTIEAKTERFESGEDRFDVTILKPRVSTASIVFAAGRGGNPTRHLGLLGNLADNGFFVVAPHSQMLESHAPTTSELVERGRGLAVAMNHYFPADLPVHGVGHSIGTVVLLVLAGATGSTIAGEELAFTAKRPFDRLVLFAPPTDFFRRPGALKAVTTPMQIWTGRQDRITPPVQAAFLQKALKNQTEVDLHVVEEAGHFTFMDVQPPDTLDPHPDRAVFLRSLATNTTRFLGA